MEGSTVKSPLPGAEEGQVSQRERNESASQTMARKRRARRLVAGLSPCVGKQAAHAIPAT